MVTCLKDNTKITMADGSRKQFALIEIGDKILGEDLLTGEHYEDEVEEIQKSTKLRFVNILLDDASFLESSLDHPFYEKDGWVSWNCAKTLEHYPEIKEIRHIEKGMMLKSEKGYKKIMDIKRDDRLYAVTNIVKLKKGFTFYANGILTHCETN